MKNSIIERREILCGKQIIEEEVTTANMATVANPIASKDRAIDKTNAYWTVIKEEVDRNMTQEQLDQVARENGYRSRAHMGSDGYWTKNFPLVVKKMSELETKYWNFQWETRGSEIWMWLS